MKLEEKKYAINNYLSDDKGKKEMSVFYRYLEYYTDIVAMDVENCNLVHSSFHQTTKHNVGHFYKKAANVKLNPDKLLFKIQ